MKCIVFVLILIAIGARGSVLIELLLNEDPKQLYKLNNSRMAIMSSDHVLKKMQLSKHQKNILWDVFKDGKTPQELIADELRNATELVSAAPEEDLANLNLSDLNLVQVLAQVEGFSRSQVSAISNSLKTHWTIKQLMQAESINKLQQLLCGFSEVDLQTIARDEFKKINSSVFANLNTCNDAQLKILYKHMIDSFGMPRSWSNAVVKHVGRIIVALTPNDVKSIRPSAVGDLDVGIIVKQKPELLEALTVEQIDALSAGSQMLIHENLSFLKSQSSSSTKNEICFLMGLFLRAYLLLKF